MKTVPGLLAAGLILVVLAGAVAAQPPTPPVMYQGSVTIDGEDAPVGTIVTAEIGGVEVATNAPDGIAGAGQYYLPVSNEDYVGKAVVFKVGGVVAGEHEFVDPMESPVVAVDLSAEGAGEEAVPGEEEGVPADGEPTDGEEELPGTSAPAGGDKWLGFLPAAWGVWPWPMAGLIGGAVAVVAGIVLLIRALRRHRYD